MTMNRLERRASVVRRLLRSATTQLEESLWRGLSSLADVNDFSRQVRLGPYLADFVSHRHRLIVEVDGAQHGRPLNRARDEVRDAWLACHGYHVLRFANAAVRDDPAAVLDTIRAVVEERRTLPPTDIPFDDVPRAGKRRPRPKRR